MEQYQFTLYVAGDSELAARALANFNRLVRERLGAGCSLQTIDVLREPRVARENRIIATPLLVRERPQPVIKILGDLSQAEKILIQLGLDRPRADAKESAGG